MKRVSVLVPTWRTRERTLRCLESVTRQLGPDDEVIVVDDAGADGTDLAIRDRFPQVRLLVHATNQGWTRAVLSAASHASGSYLLLLNSDTEMRAGSLDAMVRFLHAHPAHAAVAPRMVDSTGATRHELMNLPRCSTPFWHARLVRRWWGDSAEWKRWHALDVDHERMGNVEQPPGACLLVCRADWDLCGGVDPSMQLFFSDVELCARLRELGRLVAYLPAAVVEHLGGASTAQRTDFAAVWHRDRYTYHSQRFGLAGALCAWLSSGLDLAAHLVSRATPEPALPLLTTWLAMPWGQRSRA